MIKKITASLMLFGVLALSSPVLYAAECSKDCTCGCQQGKECTCPKTNEESAVEIPAQAESVKPLADSQNSVGTVNESENTVEPAASEIPNNTNPSVNTEPAAPQEVTPVVPETSENNSEGTTKNEIVIPAK